MPDKPTDLCSALSVKPGVIKPLLKLPESKDIVLLLRIQIHSLNPALSALRQHPLAKGLTRPKVKQYRQVVLAHHDVFRVDVVVRQPERVEVGHCRLERGHELVSVEVASLPDVVQQGPGVPVQHKTSDAPPPGAHPVVLGEMRVWVRCEVLQDKRLGEQDPGQKADIVCAVEFLVGKQLVHGHVGALDKQGLARTRLRRHGEPTVGEQDGEDVAVGNQDESILDDLRRGLVPRLGELAEEDVVVVGKEVVGQVLERAGCRVVRFDDGVKVLQRQACG